LRTDVTSGAEAGKAAVGATSAVDDGLVAELVARAQAGGVKLTGEGGLLQQLTKRVLESALEGELTDHLGHEPGERAEGGRENYRNGHRSPTGKPRDTSPSRARGPANDPLEIS
jgi:putative transposase